MRLMLPRLFISACVVGLFVATASTTTAGNSHSKRCATCVTETSVTSTSVAAAPVVVDPCVAEPKVVTTKSLGHSLLVVHCPAEAIVTIDGRVTHAGGTTRQYDVSYAGEVHNCRIELRLHDGGKVYEFDHPLGFNNGKQTALTVTRKQMINATDKQESETIAKLFASGTTFKVTGDGKLEVVDDSETSKGESPIKKGTPNAADAQLPSPLRRTREQQLKMLAKEKDLEKTLAKQETEKQTRWEAANRVLQQQQDGLQIKNVEVNAAVTDSAATLAAKRLEAKRLELAAVRALEVERQANSELAAAKHEHQVVVKRINGLKESIEAIERKMIDEQLRNNVAAEAMVLQKFRDLAAQKQAQLNAAQKLHTKALEERVAKRDESLEAEVRLAKELVQKLEEELADARREFEKSTKRHDLKQHELNDFVNFKIHVDLPLP